MEGVEKKLIVNSDKGNLIRELVKSMNECERFYFSVAFINFSGLQLLLDSLKNVEHKGYMKIRAIYCPKLDAETGD